MKIFLSHSHDDKALADALVDFLITGIGIDHNSVFCSSVAGKGIPLGLNFNDYIVKQLKDQDVQVIALITNNYFNSNYCMYELGASWGLCKNTIPILGPRMQYANMDGFIASNIGVKITNDEDINTLTEDLQRKFPGYRAPLNTYLKSKQDFLNKVKSLDKPKAFINKHFTSIVKNNHSYKYKVVAFDFDGTLLQSHNPMIGNAFHYSWKSVWSFLNYDDRIRRDLYDRHRNDPKNYTYQDWCDECVHYFKQKHFNRNNIKDIIEKEGLRVADGLLTTLKSLKKRGITTAIISGGIDTFFEETFDKEIKELFAKVFFNRFEYDSSGYLIKAKAYQNRESDFGGKVDALKEVCKMANCSIEEAVFVGEGTNDIAVAKSGCLAIAYPPSATQDYKDIADIVTEDFNLASILCDILIPKPKIPRKSNYRRKR